VAVQLANFLGRHGGGSIPEIRHDMAGCDPFHVVSCNRSSGEFSERLIDKLRAAVKHAIGLALSPATMARRELKLGTMCHVGVSVAVDPMPGMSGIAGTLLSRCSLRPR
jgi:hypothetical protein